MRKVLLSLAIVSLLASCGGGTTETATETCTESYSEETSQLNKKYEKTYFDDVFELVNSNDRDYLFLAKDMTWYNLSGGSMLFASYGTYTIKNGIVTLTEEYSDSPDGGNNVYKYNIKYKGSDIFLSDTDKEYKICNVENKEKIFGDVIELRRNNKGTQQENTNDYSWMHGKWRLSGKIYDPYVGTIYVNTLLEIDQNDKTMIMIDEDHGDVDCCGKYTIDKNKKMVIADGMYVRYDEDRKQFYEEDRGTRTYYRKIN